MIELLRAIRSRPIVAGILVTAITLVVAGGAVVAVTSAGCNVFRGARCTQGNNTAALTSPSPSTSSSRSPIPSPQITQLPTQQPTTTPASANPPYVPPASGYPAQPNYNPASGVPFWPPSSSGGSSPYLPHQLACSLPVYAGGPGSGGFIAFPEGTFIADPKSNVTVPLPPGTTSPQPGEGFTGFFGLTYDRAYSKWMAVQARWVSPDGAHYAFPFVNAVYVVDVATGTETELGKGSHPWSVLDVVNDGVYAGYTDVGGLWFLPFSGSPRQITNSGYWQGVASGAAYGTATSSVPGGATSTILRLDLATATTKSWFTLPGGQSSVGGFDLQGHPIVYVNGPNLQSVWLTTGPGVAKALVNGAYYNTGVQGSPVADANGIWFNGYGYGIAPIVLYTNGAFYGMTKIAATVAGGCS